MSTLYQNFLGNTSVNNLTIKLFFDSTESSPITCSLVKRAFEISSHCRQSRYCNLAYYYYKIFLNKEQNVKVEIYGGYPNMVDISLVFLRIIKNEVKLFYVDQVTPFTLSTVFEYFGSTSQFP